MALYDLVAVTTATTGTGTLTLGSAVAGYRSFSGASIPNGTVVSYAIENGTQRETGTGTYNTAGTTLTRTLKASSTGALLNLSGTSTVFITALASDIPAPSSVAEIRAGVGSGYVSPANLASAVGFVSITRASAAGGLDFGTFINASILLDANLTVSGWIVGYPGQTGIIRFIQNGTGGFTVAWASGYIVPAGFALQGTANGVTDVPYICQADNKIRLYNPSKWTA